MAPPLVGIHGIGNYKPALTPQQAALSLAGAWRPKIAEGYRNAQLDDPPDIVAAYYADLVADGAQGGYDDLTALTPQEQEWAWAWLRAAGVPDEMAQAQWSMPIRQGLDWLARKNNTTHRVLARLVGAFLRQVYVYMTRPPVRREARGRVITALEAGRPKIVVAHSLGSVVAYEALHQRPDIAVDLLITLGSPLGLREAIFDGLDPAPTDGRGLRPPGVGRWVNIADPGDLVATPLRLGDRFDVDLHAEAHIGQLDFHQMGNYLAAKLVAAAIMPYA